MGLLDRLPGEGSRGVVVAVVTGVVALVAAGLLGWHTWGGDDTPAPAAADRTPQVVPIVSRKGGFVLAVPARMRGEQVDGRTVRLRPPRGPQLVVTVGRGPDTGLRAAHRAAMADLETGYPQVRVDRRVDTTWGARAALRSVGSVRDRAGEPLLFSVTTTTLDGRSWSAVMFADRDVKPRQLERWYQPVLDGFRPLG